MKDFRSLEQKIRAMYEGKVPDNWEENPKSKRVATAKKLTNDAMDHDKTDKILPHVPKITEAAKDDDNDADNKPNAKKSANDGDADNMDAKEIKGGKTEVDMHPKTDDKPEGENEDDDAPKTAKKNQKGVKEMHNPTKNFGLSDSLIEAVRKVMAPVEEELKGGQKKLDKNHNGKLDGQDFKMLRKEEALDEISSKLASKAAEKARNLATMNTSNGKPAAGMAYRQQANRLELGAEKRRGKEEKAGVSSGKRARMEEEQIDELSRKTLNSYAYKADKQLTTVNANGPSHKAGIPGYYKGKNKDLGKNPADKMKGRKAGINMAVKKLNTEEVVSEGPTSPVIKKEKFDTADMVAKFKAKGGTVTKGKTAAAYGAKVPKRTKAMKEDVELSADEMARIEAIIAEIKL